VQSVRAIYNHYKRHGIATEVMGASFRNIGQIMALAGCDLLTISPELLAQLQASEAPLQSALDAEPPAQDLPAVHLRRSGFRWALNDDAMATEKLAEGIRAFAADAGKLDHTDPGAATMSDPLRPHPAWAALQGHFEAHGRDLDLREAFARDPGRFEPSACRRPRSLPTCRRT
jgi:hypothetical protein